MRRFALLLLLVIFVPSLFTRPAQAASPEDVRKVLNYMAHKSASERVLRYHSNDKERVIGVELIYEKRRYTIYYHPYAKDSLNVELPQEKQQLSILARNNSERWESAFFALDTGLSGKQVMYVEMAEERGWIRSRGTKLSEDQKQEGYDTMIKAVLEFYEQK